jgi:glutathione S-transferase
MSDAPIRIHGYPISTWTRTLRMTCAEKGVDHELVPVAYGTDAHGVLHPFRRMPILEVGEVIVFETLAATGYVDETFDGPALQPADAAGRAAMRTWMGVCGDYLPRQVVRAIPRTARRPRRSWTVPARRSAGRNPCSPARASWSATGSRSPTSTWRRSSPTAGKRRPRCSPRCHG